MPLEYNETSAARFFASSHEMEMLPAYCFVIATGTSHWMTQQDGQWKHRSPRSEVQVHLDVTSPRSMPGRQHGPYLVEQGKSSVF